MSWLALLTTEITFTFKKRLSAYLSVLETDFHRKKEAMDFLANIKYSINDMIKSRILHKYHNKHLASHDHLQKSAVGLMDKWIGSQILIKNTFIFN